MPDIFDRMWARRAIRSSTSFTLIPFFKTFLKDDIKSNYKSIHLQFASGMRFKAITDMKAFYKAATKGVKAESRLVYRELQTNPDPKEFNVIFAMLMHYIFWISDRCTANSFPSEDEVKSYLTYLLSGYKQEILTIHITEVEKL